MATPITNQKSASVKYKFGDDELDLNDYIRNLNHNYQSYVNSQNWNEGQRQEFRSAYDNFLKGLQDQLANNTNRFSTDFSGSIIDSTGQLSNTDNDDIDPVGSEYYYNDKGDRITTDDLNTMRKRQQKKYSTFSANRQVATFFNKVGTALRDARKNKPAAQNQSNAFNLSKHGFLANWETANNPAGGKFDLSPYLEKDTLDETTGLRGTTNRAAYLKEQIENYLNNVGNYDFSGTPFKDRETYISKLRAAADNLGNGYNSEDVIALNQAGIGNEFLGQFFSTGGTDKPKTEAEQAHIANNLDWAYKSNLLTDRVGDSDYYIVPGSEDYQKEQNIQTKVKETGKTREQIEAGERKPSEEGFSTIDKVRLGTAIADATAAAAAFVPGYGTAASGILGVGSTLTNIGADIADDSMSAGDVVKNAAYGLGMDIVGLIPGWGASGKAAKIVRILKPVSKLVMRSLQGYGMVQSAGAFSKLMSNPSDMSADDWRHIITGLQTIGGEARYRGAKIANKRELSRQQSATPYKTIVTESGNTVKLSPEQFNKVRKASGIDAQNRALQEVAPGEKLGKEFITGKFNRLRHPLHQNPETGSGVDYDSQDWSKVRYLPIGYTVKDGQVKPRVLSNAWISKKQGYGVIGDERFSWFKRKENPLYKPEKVKSKRDKIDESIQKHFDTNPNYVFRKEGGTIDLVKIRKFQNAGKFPEWYSKLYKFSQLKDWNTNLDYSSAGPSITNKNAGHFKAGDLNEAYNKNASYISNPNLVSSDLQSYYSSSFNGKPLDDYIAEYNANAAKIRGYWDSERAYRESGASGHNQLFKNMFKSRSGNSEDAWNIGYDSNLEDTVGSSTWLRRMDRYEKEFDQLSDEEKKQRIHKIDLGNGNFGYVYKKANGDIAKWEEPTDSTKPSEPTPAKIDVEDTPQPKADGKKGISSIFSKLSPTITHGIPRAMYADRMNRKITDLAKESLTPLLKDPFEVHRYTRSDLDAEMQGERNYADLRRLASRPITSDGSLQTATQLQAEVQGQEARTLGKEKSNQVQRQYDELAWQQEKENAANRHETAMFNRAQQWGVEQDKSKFEQAYLSKKFNIWDVVGQQLEYDERVKQQENKALTDNFARSDIHNTRWSGKSMQSIPEQISIIKKGGVVSAKNGSKIAVAGIEAKTADAERFQKQIKETIDRNEKAIDRLSKSLYGIIKASMIK